MGPWGSIWVPSSEVRISFFLCCFTFLFIGKQVPNPAEGRGQVQDGERHLPPANGARLVRLARFSAYAEKGLGEAGSTTVCLWSVGGRWGLSCLSNNSARDPVLSDVRAV